jgi:protease I
MWGAVARKEREVGELSGKRVAMLLAKDFEDVEATDPKQYLEARGAQVTTIGMARESYAGKKGASLTADLTFAEARADEFDALIIPGGGAPENLRIEDEAVAFTRAFVESGRPVAAICHGPQLLISAEVVRGRTLTCVKKIRDDVKNAGANYVDEALVVDGNLITSRTPADLPRFNEGIARALTGAPVLA